MCAPSPSPSRRSLLDTALAALLIGAIARPAAWADGRPAALDAWTRDLVALKDELLGGRISVLNWQVDVERLNRSVPVADLVRYIDLPALARDFTYQSNLADIANPALPPELLGPDGMRRWFVRIFGMRRSGAIIPHAHNNMVSAHLVVSGGFHARTFDRLGDLPRAVRLKPSQDRTIAVGDVISMSDRRDNAHWLVAEADQSMTFDVGIVDVPASWPYGLKAGAYNMIYLDPTVPPESNGEILAPVIDFDQAAAKFAA